MNFKIKYTAIFFAVSGLFSLYYLTVGVGYYYLLPIYFALIIVGISSSILFEVFFDRILESTLAKKFVYKAGMIASGLAMTVVYGPRIFIKYYEYDDWVYIPYRYADIGFEYIFTPVNDHFVPLFKIVLYFVGLLSDPTYFGNAVVFYLSSLLIVFGLGRVLLTHTAHPALAAGVTFAFAIWPTFDSARTWFGGGFWLALPVGFFLIVLLVVKQVLTSEVSWKTWVGLAVAGGATVLSSSQILIPSFFIGIYIIPIALGLAHFDRRVVCKKAVFVLLILFLPTIIAILGRYDALSHAKDWSGLYGASLFRNIGSFVSVKILMLGDWQRYWQTVVFLFLIAILFCFCLYFYSRRGSGFLSHNQSESPFMLSASLFFCSFSMFIVFFVQVGLGRSWEVYAAINAYYMSFPILSFFMGGGAIFGMLVAGFPRCYDIYRNFNKRLKFKQAFFACVFVFLSSVFVFSIYVNFPNKDYVEKVRLQKEFVSDFSVAVCDVLGLLPSTDKIFFVQEIAFSDCSKCSALFKAPNSFLDLITDDAFFVNFLAKTVAEHACRVRSDRVSLKQENAEIVESGVNRSGDMIRFYGKYFD